MWQSIWPSIEALFDPKAAPSSKRWGLLWVWLGAGIFQGLVALAVWGLLQPMSNIPGQIGLVFSGLLIAAWGLLEVRKAGLRDPKPATLVQKCLLDAALLGFALVLAGLSLRMGLGFWPGLLALLGLGAYVLGLLRLSARL